MWQILGNLYQKDTDLSKDFLAIKELIRKALLKNPEKLSLVWIINQMKAMKYADCNLMTILKAVEEVQKEETTEKKCININIVDIIITVDDLPF